MRRSFPAYDLTGIGLKVLDLGDLPRSYIDGELVSCCNRLLERSFSFNQLIVFIHIL